MTPPADKPMDRSYAVEVAKAVLNPRTDDSSVWECILARAVLEMDEELRKREEPKP